MGERIFSFHKNLNECAEAAEAYLAVPLPCPEILSPLSSRLEMRHWQEAEAADGRMIHPVWGRVALWELMSITSIA